MRTPLTLRAFHARRDLFECLSNYDNEKPDRGVSRSDFSVKSRSCGCRGKQDEEKSRTARSKNALYSTRTWHRLLLAKPTRLIAENSAKRATLRWFTSPFIFGDSSVGRSERQREKERKYNIEGASFAEYNFSRNHFSDSFANDLRQPPQHRQDVIIYIAIPRHPSLRFRLERFSIRNLVPESSLGVAASSERNLKSLDLLSRPSAASLAIKRDSVERPEAEVAWPRTSQRKVQCKGRRGWGGGKEKGESIFLARSRGRLPRWPREIATTSTMMIRERERKREREREREKRRYAVSFNCRTRRKSRDLDRAAFQRDWRTLFRVNRFQTQWRALQVSLCLFFSLFICFLLLGRPQVLIALLCETRRNASLESNALG